MLISSYFRTERGVDFLANALLSLLFVVCCRTSRLHIEALSNEIMKTELLTRQTIILNSLQSSYLKLVMINTEKHWFLNGTNHKRVPGPDNPRAVMRSYHYNYINANEEKHKIILQCS